MRVSISGKRREEKDKTKDTKGQEEKGGEGARTRGAGIVRHHPYMSSDSALSSSASSSSSPLSASALSAFLASSSSFFLAVSTSFRAFHFLANSSASATSSHKMMLSKIVPPFTCHKSNPKNPKSAYE